MTKWTLTVLISLIVAAATNAAEVSMPDTRVERLHSKSNGVQYTLLISIPHDYDTSKKTYPVLYLLDADYSFPIVRGIVQHLSDRSRLRQILIVAIAYDDGPSQYRMNRTRDYTPRFVAAGGYGPEYQKVSGGGPKFLQFIREELIPWVDGNFRTVPGERGIVGHSYGGLFASWVLLTAPKTFSRYVIVSPSLWYGGRFMFDIEKTAALDTPARVYLGVGSREGNAQRDMVNDLRTMAARLTMRKTLAVKREVFDDETHDSVFPTAVSRGIRFVFEGD